MDPISMLSVVNQSTRLMSFLQRHNTQHTQPRPEPHPVGRWSIQCSDDFQKPSGLVGSLQKLSRGSFGATLGFEPQQLEETPKYAYARYLKQLLSMTSSYQAALNYILKEPEEKCRSRGISDCEDRDMIAFRLLENTLEERKSLDRGYRSSFGSLQSLWTCKRRLGQRLVLHINTAAQRPFARSIAELQDLEDERFSNGSSLSLSTFDEWTGENLKGSKALEVWKKCAGSGKTWRRYERVQTSDSKVLVLIRYGSLCFYQPLLWLPQAFVRSPNQQRHSDIKRTLVSKTKIRTPRKHFKLPFLGVEEDEESNESQRPQQSLKRPRELCVHELDDTGLPGAYMRLTWGSAATPSGQLDRFLPGGLILQSRWHVLSFLRNDSHADVYAVTDIHEQLEASTELELHLFLAGNIGNSATYARRKQERMYNSRRCLGRFWYGERRVLVVQIPRTEEPYQTQMKDFPALTGNGSKSKWQIGCAFRHCKIPTYAEVLNAPAGSLQSPPLHQRLKEEENQRFEKIKERVREKRSRKQRDKRHSQRLAMRQARVQEDDGIGVAVGTHEGARHNKVDSTL